MIFVACCTSQHLWHTLPVCSTQCLKKHPTRTHSHSRNMCVWSLPQINCAHMLKVSTSWLGFGSGWGPRHKLAAVPAILGTLYFSGFISGAGGPRKTLRTWILFLASSRWWISLGQSCMTVVSCLSWQSRYFSPASTYSLHSWVWRLITPALPLPRTRPPAPLSAALDRGPLRGSAGPRSSSRRMVARRRMTAEEEASGESGQVRPRGDGCQTMWRVAGGSRSQLCVQRENDRKRERFQRLLWLVCSNGTLIAAAFFFFFVRCVAVSD